MRSRILTVLAILVGGGLLAACGSQTLHTDEAANTPIHQGGVLFAQRCSGCHTLAVAGTEGSATLVRDRERVDGPNFDVRKECSQNVLYAIRNGGYSGAIMPENIAVGKDADDIAAFLQRYSGLKGKIYPGSPGIGCNAQGQAIATSPHPTNGPNRSGS